MTLCHFQPRELLQVSNDVSFQVKINCTMIPFLDLLLLSVNQKYNL